MISNIQCDFPGHLHLLLHLRVTLSTNTHIVFHVVKESQFQNDKDCVGLREQSLTLGGAGERRAGKFWERAVFSRAPIWGGP